MAKLFTNAKVVAPTKSASKKSDKSEVPLAGLEQLAQIDTLIKALTAAKTTLEADVKSAAFDHFFNEAQATAKRPDNFRGVEGDATASIEMRKRSTASALSDEEVSLFEQHGLAVEKVVSVQQLFGINPSYASNDEVMEKVSNALEDLIKRGSIPADIIVVQEEKSKNVVGEATIEKAFSIKAPREIIEAISVMAIKSKLNNIDISSIIDSVKKVLV